jgi:hypothetical protein
MTNIKANLSKRKDAQIEIVRAVRQNVEVVYTKVMVARSTTSAATELGALRVCQLALFLVTKIG